MILVYLLQLQLNAVDSSDKELYLFSKLMRARLSFMLDKSLSSSVVHLMDESLTLFAEYTEALTDHVSKNPTATPALQLLLAE